MFKVGDVVRVKSSSLITRHFDGAEGKIIVVGLGKDCKIEFDKPVYIDSLRIDIWWIEYTELELAVPDAAALKDHYKKIRGDV